MLWPLPRPNTHPNLDINFIYWFIFCIYQPQTPILSPLPLSNHKSVLLVCGSLEQNSNHMEYIFIFAFFAKLFAKLCKYVVNFY